MLYYLFLLVFNNCTSNKQVVSVSRYEKSSRFMKEGYERDFLRYLQSLLAEVERRIRRGHARLALSQAQQNAGVSALGWKYCRVIHSYPYRAFGIHTFISSLIRDCGAHHQLVKKTHVLFGWTVGFILAGSWSLGKEWREGAGSDREDWRLGCAGL